MWRANPHYVLKEVQTQGSQKGHRVSEGLQEVARFTPVTSLELTQDREPQLSMDGVEGWRG